MKDCTEESDDDEVFRVELAKGSKFEVEIESSFKVKVWLSI